MKEKVYLGDKVYAEINEFGLTLTTSNGSISTNTIHLDIRVLNELIMFSIKKGIRAAAEKREATL